MSLLAGAPAALAKDAAPSCQAAARKAAIALSELDSWAWERKGGEVKAHDLASLDLSNEYGIDKGTEISRTLVPAKTKDDAAYASLSYRFKSANASDKVLATFVVDIREYDRDASSFCQIIGIRTGG